MTDRRLSSWLTRLLPNLSEDSSSFNIPALVQEVRVYPQKSRLIIYLLFSTKPDLQSLIQLEKEIEQGLKISEVIVAQKLAQTCVGFQEKNYVSEIYPWLLRHCQNQDALCYSWLQDSKLIHRPGRIKVELPFEDKAYIPGQSQQWLEGFLKKYSALAVEVELVQAKNAPEVKEEKQPLLTAETISKLKTQRKERSKKEVKEAPRFSRSWQNGVWGNAFKKDLPLTAIKDIGGDLDWLRVEGELFGLEKIITKNGRLMLRFAVTDKKDSIGCRLFANLDDEAAFSDLFCHGYALLEGKVKEDSYLNENILEISSIRPATKPLMRTDQAPEKRVELHIHSKMSARDGLINVSDLVEKAAAFGHQAIALTDHGVVQAFPEAAETAAGLASKGQKIKIIYGLEGYLLKDGLAVGWQPEGIDLEQGFISLALKATGTDPKEDQIEKISAIHYLFQEGSFLEERRYFFDFSQKDQEEPKQISKLSVLADLANLCQDLPLIGVDILSSLSFLRRLSFTEAKKRLKFNPSAVDLGRLAQAQISSSPGSKISDLLELLNLDLAYSGSIEDQAEAAGRIFIKLLEASGQESIKDLIELSGRKSFAALREEKVKTNHLILLAADQLGLYNLYRLVSKAHLEDFYYRPRIRQSWLEYFSEGLIKGAACSRGEIFSHLLDIYQQSSFDYQLAQEKIKDKDLLALARSYAYLEVQPLTNNRYLLQEGRFPLRNEEDLKNLNRLVIELAKLADRPVCATSDAHYLDPEDKILRQIVLHDLGFNLNGEGADLYFKTTEEMLTEFSYLGEELAEKIVIKNPLAIADQIEDKLLPFPQGSFPPVVEQAEEVLVQRSWAAAKAIYGRDDLLPEIVSGRVKSELNAIIDNGFAVMYYITSELVRKSNQDGYIVGSRGSVGSSLVATFCGITEVNPLPPHYVCPACHFTEFDSSGSYGSGYDLPEKNCPLCQTKLKREGQDIPFETFLGFDGDKQPDIDLNFSGEYQPRAHKFIETMFGAAYTFRAGTISGYAEKNSTAMVLNYFEEQGRAARRAEVRRLAAGISGVKRTTGQHPGGIVVVPREYEIYDFTPIQHPADKADAGVITTHFDFNALHDTILKLDILGHDDPSMLKMLGDITGIDVNTIPIPDPAVMSLFQGTDALGIPMEKSSIGSAVIGIPEMGTFAARRMIAQTKPTSYYDLVQISGLSHGRGVWTGNAQELISDGTCSINDVIGCRDSIMTRLIYSGLPDKMAFDIMERVRRGKGLLPEQAEEMRNYSIPDWYIESCDKIQYMFPKAHAVAYTISSLRIAWFKVHYPEAYYSTYFTVRAAEFDSSLMCLPENEVRKNRRELGSKGRLDLREQKIYYILELVEEMQQRGIDFLPLSLEDSAAVRFSAPAPKQIRPPLSAIPGVSAAQAEQIVRAREERAFSTQDDLAKRAGVGPAVLQALLEAKSLGDLPKSDQLDLFSLLEGL